MKNKIKLPPRKWYSLQQAAEKLTRELDESVIIDDLLHYCQIEQLELSVYIKKAKSAITIGDITFSDLKLREVQKILPRTFLDFNIMGEYQEDILIEHIFSIKKGIKESYSNELVKTKLSSNDDELDKVTFIDGFMNLWAPIGNSPQSIDKIKEKGFMLNNINYLVSPNIGNDLRIVIKSHTNWNCEEDVFITLDNVYILESDLQDFLNGKSEHRKIDEILKRNKGGRPSIKHKEEIILLAKKIFKAYPEHNRERIKEAILELVNNRNYFNDPNFKINEITTRNLLKENEIGIPRGKSTPIRALEQFK